MSMLSKGTPLKSWRELENFLRVWGIREERAKEIWESMEKPVLLKRVRGWEGEHLWNIYLLKIVDVWERDNVRIVLWNNKVVTAVSSGNKIYNYLDRGFYRIGKFIIRTKNLSGDMVEKIKKAIKKRGSVFQDPFFPGKAITLRELEKMLEEHEEGYRFHTHHLSPGERGTAVIERISRMLKNVKVTERYFIINGRRLGVVGRKLEEYVDLSFMEEVEGDEIEWVVDHFLQGLLWESKGEQKVRIGKITAVFEFGRKIRVDGREVFRENLKPLVLRGLKAKSRREFIKILDDLQERPFLLRKFLSKGLVITGETDMEFKGVEFVIRLGVEYEKGKLYLVSPVSEERALVKRNTYFWKASASDGPGNLLESIKDSLDFNGPFFVFRVLSRLFGKEEAFWIMDHGRGNAKEAKSRAVKLLDEVLKKNRNRVFEDVHLGDEGYVVKGEMRNYFVTKEEGCVRTWPEGTYICIAEEDEHVLPEDKVVSRILLLLNDSKLRAHVNTLNGDVDEIILR